MATLIIQTQRHFLGFLIWWVYQMPAQIFRLFEGLMAVLDNSLQFAKNFRLWLTLEPLFGDYGWRGRLVGFFMRGARAVITLVVYALIFVAALLCMLGWIVLPLAATSMILGLI